MGTEYVLVDRVGRNLLEVGKLWSFDCAASDFFAAGLTRERILAGKMPDPNGNGEDNIADEMARWQAEVCEGRPLSVHGDTWDPPEWEDPDPPFGLRPGWTLWTIRWGGEPYRTGVP